LPEIEIINDETIRKEGAKKLIILTTIPQEIVEIHFRNKQYTVQSNDNGKLQMTA
jgi:hypothetical protein